ncbi:hypothetical protein PR202_ga06221 [Eleusine coracana subsp. coracana]|uniref:Uncharacterized protein n=1 Tax=Eleusine coracana subsp. coracana TaxID=191504 RepID=A0AAV5BVJ6_ELECO|nr:hypothetical protein PR202_ga06221 [Eleusine coracana subsp. coracana]
MEITLVQDAVPPKVVSACPVGNEPDQALVNSGRALESVCLPENNINCSSDGIELQRACSSTVPACHGNQLSSVFFQQSTDAPSRHEPVETESTGMLGTQVEQDLHPDMQPSTSLLDVPPQRTFTDDQSQAGCQLDKTTDMSEEDETEHPNCAIHNLVALSLSREPETDNGQKSVSAQQSKSSCAQESLSAFQHPPEEAESAGILGKLLPDDSHQSISVQDQTAQTEQAGMLGITEAQGLQHGIQPSMTAQDVHLERADLSGMLLVQSPTVLHGVQSSGDLDADPSGMQGIAAAPNLMPEIQSSSSMEDGPVGDERSGTSGTIAAQVFQPEIQPSVSIQDIPPDRTHSDDMIQISLPGQQSTGLDSQQSVPASGRPAEQVEPADILGVVVADAFQPSTLMLNQTAEAERTGLLDAVATQDSHTELLPSSTTHDVPCEETDISGMPVPQGTTSQQSLEFSRDTHAGREPENALSTLAAHDLQSVMQPSSSVQDQPVEANRAGQSDTIAAQDLHPGMQPSTVIHITPERTHSDGRIQTSPQPNQTPSQMSPQPNEAPSHQLLTQLFSVGPAAFHHLMYSSDPLRNELEKLKYCNSLLTKRHEHKKLLLQEEYNKELEKLRRKYESLHHKEDFTYRRMAAQLNDIYYKVSAQQLVAENFHEKFTKSYASQERISTRNWTGTSNFFSKHLQEHQGLKPQHYQLPCYQPLDCQRRPHLIQQGPLRSEAIQLQQTLPGNLSRATSPPLSSIPLWNGSYGAAGAQSRGPAPHLRHLQMPQPYATVHRDQQQLPIISTGGFTSLRHPSLGILTGPLAGLPSTSEPSSSVLQTMASGSNSLPALPPLLSVRWSNEVIDGFLVVSPAGDRDPPPCDMNE